MTIKEFIIELLSYDPNLDVNFIITQPIGNKNINLLLAGWSLDDEDGIIFIDFEPQSGKILKEEE